MSLRDDNAFFDRTGRWPFELHFSPEAQACVEEALRVYVGEAHKLPAAVAKPPGVLLELVNAANQIRAHLQHQLVGTTGTVLLIDEVSDQELLA